MKLILIKILLFLASPLLLADQWDEAMEKVEEQQRVILEKRMELQATLNDIRSFQDHYSQFMAIRSQHFLAKDGIFDQFDQLTKNMKEILANWQVALSIVQGLSTTNLEQNKPQIFSRLEKSRRSLRLFLNDKSRFIKHINKIEIALQEAIDFETTRLNGNAVALIEAYKKQVKSYLSELHSLTDQFSKAQSQFWQKMMDTTTVVVELSLKKAKLSYPELAQEIEKALEVIRIESEIGPIEDKVILSMKNLRKSLRRVGYFERQKQYQNFQTSLTQAEQEIEESSIDSELTYPTVKRLEEYESQMHRLFTRVQRRLSKHRAVYIYAKNQLKKVARKCSENREEARNYNCELFRILVVIPKSEVMRMSDDMLKEYESKVSALKEGGI